MVVVAAGGGIGGPGNPMGFGTAKKAQIQMVPDTGCLLFDEEVAGCDGTRCHFGWTTSRNWQDAPGQGCLQEKPVSLYPQHQWQRVCGNVCGSRSLVSGRFLNKPRTIRLASSLMMRLMLWGDNVVLVMRVAIMNTKQTVSLVAWLACLLECSFRWSEKDSQLTGSSSSSTQQKAKEESSDSNKKKKKKQTPAGSTANSKAVSRKRRSDLWTTSSSALPSPPPPPPILSEQQAADANGDEEVDKEEEKKMDLPILTPWTTTTVVSSEQAEEDGDATNDNHNNTQATTTAPTALAIGFYEDDNPEDVIECVVIWLTQAVIYRVLN